MPQNNNHIKIAITSLILLFSFGTVFYHYSEGWAWVDSFYFVGAQMTTTGSGSFYPTHTVSKIFTVLFTVLGVSVALYSLNLFGENYFLNREEALLRQISEPNSQTVPINPLSTIREVINKVDEKLRK